MRKKLTEEEKRIRQREYCRRYRETHREEIAKKRHLKYEEKKASGWQSWAAKHPEAYRKYMREYMRKLRIKQKSIVKAQQV